MPNATKWKVSDYVRARFKYWAVRWIGIVAFTTAIVGAARLSQWGVTAQSVGIILTAFAIACALTLLGTLAALTVGGMLHARGVAFPEWMTRRRGE